MIESNDGRLELELIRIFQEHSKPLNLDEIFCFLYDSRERLPELMAMTRERTVEMRRLKRNLDQSVSRGLIETSWDNGQAYYYVRNLQQNVAGSTFQLSIVPEQDRLALASRPFRFQLAPNMNDKLLSAFCVIALFVLASIGLFLIPG